MTWVDQQSQMTTNITCDNGMLKCIRRILTLRHFIRLYRKDCCSRWLSEQRELHKEWYQIPLLPFSQMSQNLPVDFYIAMILPFNIMVDAESVSNTNKRTFLLWTIITHVHRSSFANFPFQLCHLWIWNLIHWWISHLSWQITRKIQKWS